MRDFTVAGGRIVIGAVNVAAGCVSVCGAHSGAAAGAAENAPQVPSHIPPHPGVPNTAKMILLWTVLALFFSGTFCDLFLTRSLKGESFLVNKHPSLCLGYMRFDSQVRRR